MPIHLTRRDFLKSSAALVAALSVAAWFPAPRRAAGYSPQLPAQLPAAPAFTPLPSSQLATGKPVADIAAGWDGTLWAVDSLGIPHLYDPIAAAWQPFGKGVDAATVLNDEIYLFRGPDVAVYNQTTGQSAVQPIAQQWPGLPPSFTTDLDGASTIDGVIYLYRSGRYVSTAAPGTVQAMTTAANWPAAWSDGVIYQGGTITGQAPTYGLVFRPDLDPQVLLLEQGGGALAVAGTEALSSLPLYADLSTVLTAPFDAYIAAQLAVATQEATVYQGPILWTAETNIPPAPAALGTYVPTWLPVLRQAPRGRIGSLWSVTAAGTVVYHDGTAWNEAPAIPGASALGVDVGADGVPFATATAAGGAALYQFDPAALTWGPPLALGSIAPQQLSVGDTGRVYVLGSDGTVYHLANGTVAPVSTLPTGIVHFSANHDGTLWCGDGTPSGFANALRLISEQSYGPQTLLVPGGATKVASTAYGNALLLVNEGGASQLYTYTSPYVFKTSPSFVPVGNGLVLRNPQVTPGGGRVFVNLGSGIAALDSHTGEELWSQALPNGIECASIVYDPIHRLIYATDTAQTVFALQAATGAQVWSYQVTGTIGQPVLSGGGLCLLGVTLSVGVYVYWIDTATALAQAANSQAVTAAWQQQVGQYIGGLATAYIEGGYVYALVVLTDIVSTVEELWRLDVTDGTPTPLYKYGLSGEGGNGDWTGVVASTLVRRTAADAPPGTSTPMLFANTGNNVEAFPLVPGGTFTPLGVPPTNGFTQGIAYADNKVYACGTNGSLYVLDLRQPLATGPGFQPLSLPINGGTLAAGPLAAPAEGGTLIAFSVNSGISNSVCFYDPVTGNLLQLDTNHMLATQLAVDENGILYAAGQDPANPNTPFGQVYAIRLDTLLQGERDFIVESELMQDFSAPQPGELAATARYQTHVTVVDGQKAPRPFQPIKVWADTPILSLVEIDGVPYYIDATTPATVQADATGILTIVTDAADLSTTALQLWAGFMNPYERIVVYPDRTFHNRLATTHYDTTANSDPTKINLATASTYTVTDLNAPPPLLYSTQAQQGGAQAVAPVIQQFAKSVSYSSGSAAASQTPPFGSHAHVRLSGPSEGGTSLTSPSPSPYLAGTFAGAFYAPVSAPANRGVTPAAALGLSLDFTAYHAGGSPPVYTALSVAAAADVIDGLSGQEITAAPGALGSWWRDLWDAIKSGAAVVGQFVVSVGRDIYLGLKYIVQGAEYVLRQALHSIEEVAVAIGSVLAAIGRIVADVIEGLSLLFHLDKVLATANMIKQAFGTMTANLVTLIANATPTIDNLFATAEAKINSAFSSIIDSLEGTATQYQGAEVQGPGAQSPAVPSPAKQGSSPLATSSIGALNGMGATPNTIFAVGPKGTTQASSQAVPAMWGVHKLRQKYPQGSLSPSSPGSDNPLSTFLQNFGTSLLTGSYSTSYAATKSGFHARLHFDSAKDFFASLLADLLGAIETLVDDVLGFVQYLVDGVVTNAADIASLMGAAGSVQIPVISEIWQALTGSPLTVLDVIAFVVAIPVTLIYRIVEGAWPGDQLATASTSTAAQLVWQRVEGIGATVNTVLYGLFSAISDAVTISGGELTVLATLIGVVTSLGVAFDLVVGDALTPAVWVVVASIMGMVLLLLNAIPTLPSEIPSITGVALSPLLLVAYWQEYAGSPDALSLAGNVTGALPTIVNPIKFAPLTTAAPLVAPIADIACALAAAGLTLGDTIKNWDTANNPTALPEADEPLPGTSNRVFMPAVLQGE